ncbi:hypothetical protein [Hydrogenophaga sp.]|uniref:hypothetical protein n=1 Tax=Hydrogenophaga sp. TaxID=1904254 RepID=UPI0027318359|nr:hypothetical protein [Hydrogenophaga sp.]MDP2017919.1 hypothetical protein [Hydrogenophaga sp.]MDP3167895.1 hypothetical protein [Hydrogenophaga sp.]
MSSMLPPDFVGNLQFLTIWVDFIRKRLGERPIDPYLLWGLCTEFRALGPRGHSPSVLSFSVELDHPYDPTTHFTPLTKLAALRAHSVRGMGGIGNLPGQVPKSYEQAMLWDDPSALPRTPKFVTLRLDLHKDWLVVQRQVQKLLLTDDVKRLQVGLPRGVNNPDKPRGPPHKMPVWGHQPKVVIGVLEDASPFAHAALRRLEDSPSTRVVALWDQTSMRTAASAQPAPALFPYGNQWNHDQLNALLERHAVDGEVDEAAVYADAEVDYKPLAQRASHAAAVLSLLTGSSCAAPHMPQPIDTGDAPASPEEAQDDCAAQAPVVMVQLPEEQISVRAGRWLAVNALDGMHYLINAARGLAADPKVPPPLVVNMSYGSMAGPHDGSGMLESAIDELCCGYPNELAVVLAAGNAHGTLRDAEEPSRHLPSGVHAKQDLKPGGSVSFTLFIPPDKQFETYLEIWFSVKPAIGGSGPFLEIDTEDNPGEVDIVVTPPIGLAWPAVPCPGIRLEPANAPDSAADTEAGLFFMRKVSQGTRGSMALLVVAATQVSSKYVEAPAGRWLVTVRHKKPKSDTAARSFSVDAWVERDDTEVGAVRQQSARLVENADGSPSGLTNSGTFTNIATGCMTIKAGALMDRGNGLGSTQVSAYSAEAMDGAPGPDFSSIADTHPALPGIRVSGSQSGMVLRANGTSMAAPQAARYLVNRLADGCALCPLPETPGQGTARLGKKTV